jgi:hypothetical protein
MDNDTEKYYEDYIDMFSSKGWKRLIENITSKRNSLTNEWASLDNSNLFFEAKGRLSILNELLNTEAIIRNNFNAVKLQEMESDDADV